MANDQAYTTEPSEEIAPGAPPAPEGEPFAEAEQELKQLRSRVREAQAERARRPWWRRIR